MIETSAGRRHTAPYLPLWSYRLQGNSRLAVKTRKDLEAHLIARAVKDPAFKQELMAHPARVIGREMETPIDHAMEISVLEETDAIVYLVLPNNPYPVLTESQLGSLLGMSLEDVAAWVCEGQKTLLGDQASSIRLVTRAWRDPAFRRRLLDDPRQVIAAELGITIPGGLDIRVLAEDPNSFYVILPQMAAAAFPTEEVSEAELEDTAGGYDLELLVASTTTDSNCSSRTVGACCCLITN